MYSSIKIRNYKCFVKDNDYQGFDYIKPINVIIGKNNSGKSKLMEALEGIVQGTQESMPFDVKMETILEEKTLLQLFPKDISSSEFFLGQSYWDVMGSELQNHRLILEKSSQESDYKFFLDSNLTTKLFDYTHIINKQLNNPLITEQFNGYRFLHLRAERDINKETIQYDPPITNCRIEENATGICGLIARLLNDEAGHTKKIISPHRSEVNWKQYIEEDFLALLNSVTAPEIVFKRLYTLTNKNGFHEIYLEEENKGAIKLSDCGSGLKTIIAALTLLHTIPCLSGNYKNVFAFEELENNLHPSLERKLLNHIKKYALAYEDTFIFLTTHSNVAIDLFGNDRNAQIVKVCNDGYKSTVETVISNRDKQFLLDDLGVKASDLLQSNCVIWVEGPSDRIYIKKWLELFSDNTLEEGLNYQFIYYGGSILSHYSAQNTCECAETQNLIEMLKINKNSYVIMDSDKKSENTPLKSRVQKIIKDLPDNHWVTEGKEIENYLPIEAIDDYLGTSIDFNKFSLFPNIYKDVQNCETFDKVRFASEIIRNKKYTKENLCKCLDLKKQIDKLIDFIKKSNHEIC